MIKKCAKIILALGIVGLTGLCLALLGSDKAVEKSRAHIVDFRFGFEDDTEKFVNALDDMGHTPPQAYELNGNKVFFSQNLVDAEPKEVLEDYQDAFVQQGLNDRAFNSFSSMEMMQRTRTGLTGGIVPVEIREDYVAMNGVLPASGADNTKELMNAYDPTKTISETFDGYRWVEVFKTPKRGQSRVIASWSNDQFDFAKMEIPKTDLTEMDLPREVPLCTGCAMMNQFSDIDSSGEHETFIFTSDQTMSQLRHFYEREMKARGWEMAINTRIMDRVRRQIEIESGQASRLKFAKNGKTMTIGFFPGGRRGESNVRISLVDETYLQEKNLKKAESEKSKSVSDLLK
jgi:hypothetical protein